MSTPGASASGTRCDSSVATRVRCAKIRSPPIEARLTTSILRRIPWYLSPCPLFPCSCLRRCSGGHAWRCHAEGAVDEHRGEINLRAGLHPIVLRTLPCALCVPEDQGCTCTVPLSLYRLRSSISASLTLILFVSCAGPPSIRIKARLTIILTVLLDIRRRCGRDLLALWQAEAVHQSGQSCAGGWQVRGKFSCYGEKSSLMRLLAMCIIVRLRHFHERVLLLGCNTRAGSSCVCAEICPKTPPLLHHVMAHQWALIDHASCDSDGWHV